MFKKIGLFILTAGFAVHLQAAQCPHFTALSHVKGEPWKLSTRAELEGWRIGLVSSGANDSPLTEVSKGANLETTLTLYWLSRTEAACFYEISLTDLEYVSISNIRQIDMKSIPQPPFEKSPNSEHYRCSSSNSISNYCSWHWKNG